MKVLIPFSYFYPETCAGIFVVDDLTRKLADLNIETAIYVPTPTRNVKLDVLWKRDEYLCDGKIHIHRFRMYQEGKNPILRALRYVLCECVYLYYMLKEDYDVAFIDSTPPIQGLKLPIVKLFRKKPIVYNAQDLFPDTLSGAGLAKKDGLLWKIGSWVARVTFKHSDKIIAISEDIKKSIIAKGVPKEKIEVVYNWVDTQGVYPVEAENNTLYEEYGIDRNKFTVVYAGNLGNAQNIFLIVEAAERLQNNLNIQFVIFGSNGLEQEIQNKIKENNLTNITLLPLQPYERVSQVYSLGDVCIVACKAGLGGAAMPSKTWSIMSCGRPVLANFDEGELKMILENNNCGIYTKAGDIDGFVTAIVDMSKNREKCKLMGDHGREFVLNNLTKEVGTQKYVDIITNVIKQD